MEILKKIFPAIVTILLIAFGFLFYSQQKTINKLSNALTGQNGAVQSAKNGTSAVALSEIKDQKDQQIDSLKKNLESAKFIAGRVSSVSGSALTVVADMPDFQKMKELAASNDLAQKSKSALTYEKNYTVMANGETKYFSNSLDKIKAGDTIMISARELVYQTDKLTAVMITSPYEKPAAPPLQ